MAVVQALPKSGSNVRPAIPNQRSTPYVAPKAGQTPAKAVAQVQKQMDSANSDTGFVKPALILLALGAVWYFWKK